MKILEFLETLDYLESLETLENQETSEKEKRLLTLTLNRSLQEARSLQLSALKNAIVEDLKTASIPSIVPF